ncbi:uncharacterized protein LOC106674407 isoform X1 [Cimex lectularius]|uniref:Uncharacterized protein n=1 Tax=Cimex lectularius TaxID=79782 RepID=A0A8I6SAK0_CIMLE|nr:uncharacterized protein LOC106674407 isoform X1 [Cimex lectularius]
MNCPDYENLRLVDIACECHNEFVQKTKYISKKRCSTEETYDEESIYYERGGLVVCNDSSGRICVEYKKKTDDGDDNKSQHGSNNSPEIEQNDITEKIESCFPYKIKRKGGQCSAALYPYEIIRKFPFDDICKCNENKILSEEVKPEEVKPENSPASPTTNKPTENDKNKKTSSKSARSTDGTSKSSLKKMIQKKFGKRIMSLNKDKSSVTSEDMCNCFPDLNCQCPKTGEYKVLKNEYEILRDRPLKTEYLAKPCMQTFFNRCQEENGIHSSLDDAMKENDEHQTVFLDSGTKCFYNNTPCCPCPKRDPDPDHPRYLSTKVNVTDLMKQLLTFHFNRSYMSQYYSRVQMDNSDEPCEICLDKIMQAAGCVGSCCKCPKPVELKSCNCPQSSESESESTSEDDQHESRTEQLEQSISRMQQNKEGKLENKNIYLNENCGLLFQELAKQTSSPTRQNKCDCSKINYKTDYQCYNVMCTNTPGYNEINVCSTCNFWNENNLSSDEQEIQEGTHWDKQKRKITRAVEPLTEEIDTRSDCEADPFRKRNMFKGFFSKMKLDWPKKKNTLKSTEHKEN